MNFKLRFSGYVQGPDYSLSMVQHSMFDPISYYTVSHSNLLRQAEWSVIDGRDNTYSFCDLKQIE